MINMPHFNFPFSLDLAGRPKLVEQDTYEDIRNCVSAAVRTERGTRLLVSEFGLTDPIFENSPISSIKIQNEIHSSEPRAAIHIEQIVKDLMDTVLVGVGDVGV